MSCETCRRFSMATAHIGNIASHLIDDATSHITELQIHDKDTEDNLCMTFKLNGIAHQVKHDETGFAVLRDQQTPLNFVRWECDKCGIAFSGDRKGTFQPFSTYRLEMIRGLDVVVNYPIDDTTTHLVHVALPNEFTEEMSIKSFGSVIAIKGPCINVQLLFGDLTPFILLYVPIYLQLLEPIPMTQLMLMNMISLQNDNMSIILCSYAGAAMSIYISKVNTIHEMRVVANNIDAILKIDTMNNHRLVHIESVINGKSVDISFIRSGSECVPISDELYPAVRWTFVGRTIHAIMLD
jgi:hypothetical protein